MAKKAKQAAKTTVRAGARDVRSRAGRMPDERRTLTIEKFGKAITYNVPHAPYQDDEAKRAAFVGGFEHRVRQVNSPLEAHEYQAEKRFDVPGLQQAFEDGYNAAATQDQQHATPAALSGSSSGKAPKK